MNTPELPGSVPAWLAERGGARFSCISGCVRCCGGAPGDVFITPAELEAIAAQLNLAPAAFDAAYVRHYASGALSIRERPNGDCLLLDPAKGCTVYAVRPRQCRDYPFWPEILASPFAWMKEAQRCPGLDAGEWHPVPKIAELMRQQMET